MRDSFPGFYSLSQAEFENLWKKCTFVVDANVLLNSYRYPQQARNSLISALKATEKRIWLPFHAGLEYQRNRPLVIAEQKKRFSEVKELVSGIVPTLEADFGRMQLRDRHSVIDPDKLISSIRPPIDEFLSELSKLDSGQVNVHDEDPLRDIIDELFAGRVGPSPTQEQIDKICSVGEQRFKHNAPPGFMDSRKDDAEKNFYSYMGVNYQGKFGDLIIWNQILDFAAGMAGQDIVFLTDDEKQDWWWTINSQGKKRLGPRPELVAEMANKKNGPNFYMYNSEQFLKHAKSHLNIEASEETLRQVRDIARSSLTGIAADRFRKENEADEEAALRWLAQKNPDHIFQIIHGWPDAVFTNNDGDSFAVDVTVVRNPSIIATRLRDRFFRGFHAVQTQGYSRVEYILVLRGEDIERSLRLLSRTGTSIPPNVRLTAGTIEESDGERKFVPVYEGYPELDIRN